MLRIALLSSLCLMALLPAGCAGPKPAADELDPPSAAFVATDLAFTVTREVWSESAHVGYVVEVLPVPDGYIDQRAYKPGTLVIESLDLVPLGFISPRGTSYQFDDDNVAQVVAFGGRDASVARFFRLRSMPRYITVAGRPDAPEVADS